MNVLPQSLHKHLPLVVGESIKSEEVVEVSFLYHEMVGVEFLAADRLVCSKLPGITCRKDGLYPSWPFQNIRGYCNESEILLR